MSKQTPQQRIGKALRKYRVEHDLTLRALANRIDRQCTARLAQQYCRGKVLPGTKRMLRIAELCGKTVNEFMNGKVE